MIVCYHREILKPWTDIELQERLSFLPDNIQKPILLKRNHLDVQLSVSGNLLLLELIKHFGLDLKLSNLIYGEHKRPYFNNDFDFNISHSGNRVICCATKEGKVGIDIELMQPVSINYDDYFTPTEQANIRAAQNPEAEFFRYWTKKEALLKAVGTGMFTPLLDIDVSEDEVQYRNGIYYLSPIDIDEDYLGCIAHTFRQDILIKELIL
ncbi:MAG: 4'-phosphopantetheinyl transferase superfamily protein [Mucilaginibacter sp.]|nr:4'-phosphopantetheinyl transferase superfamily protein [Mucilaginibacter sp.]